MLHVLTDLFLQFRPEFLLFLEFSAGFRRDDKTLRHTNAQIGHLGKVRTFSTEKKALVAIAFLKVINKFLSHR